MGEHSGSGNKLVIIVNFMSPGKSFLLFDFSRRSISAPRSLIEKQQLPTARVFAQVYASAPFSPSGRTKVLSKFLITNSGGE